MRAPGDTSGWSPPPAAPPCHDGSGFCVSLGSTAGISWQALGPPFLYFPKGPILGPIQRWLSAKESGENLSKCRPWEREERQAWRSQLWSLPCPFLQSPGHHAPTLGHHWGPRDSPLLGCIAATAHRGKTLGPALVCHFPLTAGMMWARKG